MDNSSKVLIVNLYKISENIDKFFLKILKWKQSLLVRKEKKKLNKTRAMQHKKNNKVEATVEYE